MAERGDATVWRRATADVAPLRLRPALPPAAPPSRREPERRIAPAPTPIAATPAAPPLDRFAGLDRATAERLKRGRLPIEARLDLHGMTQAEAHRALGRFVAGSRVAERRCILVITGRSGVLRDAAPRWLEEAALRPHVLAIAAAQPRDGGGGALYLLLRRLAR